MTLSQNLQCIFDVKIISNEGKNALSMENLHLMPFYITDKFKKHVKGIQVIFESSCIISIELSRHITKLVRLFPG